MGNAKIWYYPDPDGTVEEIDLGEQLSNLEPMPYRSQAVHEGLTGATSTLHFSSRERFRFTLERFTSAGVAASLEAFRNHVQRGGHFSLAEDSAQAWAGFLAYPPDRGDTSVTILGKPWQYVSGASVASGDYLVLESPSPTRLRERVALSSAITAADLVASLSTGCVYNYTGERWVLARHRGFYPVLRLPPDQRDQPILTHDHRISWTLEVTCETNPALLEVFWNEQDAVTGNGLVPGELPTFESLLDGGTIENPGGGHTAVPTGFRVF